MAEAALGRRALTLPSSRVEAREWVIAHWDVLALAGLMAVAAVLRFWDLGSRALHHDESLHAQFSYYLYDGTGFNHDPLMHGTFLFHVSALVYFLFGATDFTARIAPALFGTVLVGLPYLLKKQIGVKAVLFCATFLAFSPTLLYYSRFDRNEPWMAVWTLAMVICVWRYLDEHKDGWLYALAALMALSFVSKEVTFITVAIMLVFVDLFLAIELGRKREGESLHPALEAARIAAFVPIAWAVAALWPLLGARPLGRERLPPIGDVMIVLGTLSLPQFSAAVQVLPFVGNQGYFPLSTVTAATPEDNLRITTVVVLLIVSLYVGLLWKPKVWAIAAAFFYVPYVVLFTTFFTNQPAPWTGAFWDGRGGFFSGIWGSLDYWLDQHHVKRGNQPVYYYTLLTPLYEFLPLLLALAGAAWMVLKGDSFKRWLLFWLAGIFIGLSVAGEKMPWLEVHIALPLAMAGGIVLARAVEALDFSVRDWRSATSLAAACSLATVLMVSAPGIADLTGIDAGSIRFAGGLLLGVSLGSTFGLLAFGGIKAGGRAALTVAVAVLLTLTVRAGTMASFNHGDVPVEMLVYTQSSPEIPDLRDRIDELARQSGLGKNLPIVVDATDGFSWPWAWYLRDYHEVQYPTISQPFVPPENAVLLIARQNVAFIDSTGYTATPYKHRWWFIEESYRNLTAAKLWDRYTQPLFGLGPVTIPKPDVDNFGHLADFWLFRRSETFTGSVDAVAFFPETLSNFDRPIKPAAPPVRLEDGRIVIGKLGLGQGEFNAPADAYVDAERNVWVADTNNNRIQKFDSAGNFLAILGGGGSAPGRFNQPWSVVVDEEGFIYVADTWNHRIQKFAPDFSLVAVWGEFYFGPSPGPLQLYGPRDIAIGPDGTLWVTDMGNKRIVNYSRDGDFIQELGAAGSGLGQFDEEVGIAFDAAGNLYVADTWNERIQRFGPGPTAPAAFAAGWTSKDAQHKPYLTVLADGRVLATEPSRGHLMLFDFRSPVRSWQLAQGSRPIGVAALPGGGFVFTDSLKNQVQIVPASLVDQLFR